MPKPEINVRAWALLIFFTFLYILGYADRILIMAFANAIQKDLCLTYFEYSILSASAFILFYTVSGLYMGALADRVHRPRLIAIGLVIWTSLTAITGLAKSFVQITIPRAFIGVGESTLIPSALSMLTEVFPSNKRGLASALFYLGVPLGTYMGFEVAALLGPRIGWRRCFYLMGAIGAFALPVLLAVKDQRGNHSKSRVSNEIPFRETLREFLLTLRQTSELLLVMLASILVVFAQGALAFNQQWLTKERGFQETDALKFSGIIFLAGGILGSIFSGVGSDWFKKKWRGGRILFLTFIHFVAAPSIIMYRLLSPQSVAFGITACIASMSIMFVLGPVIATVQDLVPSRIRAISIAACIFAFAVFGNAFGSVTAGWLSDHFTQIGIAEPITWAMLTTSFPMLVAVILYYIAYRRLVDREQFVA